jgi:hypothetical protein
MSEASGYAPLNVLVDHPEYGDCLRRQMGEVGPPGTGGDLASNVDLAEAASIDDFGGSRDAKTRISKSKL